MMFASCHFVLFNFQSFDSVCKICIYLLKYMFSKFYLINGCVVFLSFYCLWHDLHREDLVKILYLVLYILVFDIVCLSMRCFFIECCWFCMHINFLKWNCYFLCVNLLWSVFDIFFCFLLGFAEYLFSAFFCCYFSSVWVHCWVIVLL